MVIILSMVTINSKVTIPRMVTIPTTVTILRGTLSLNFFSPYMKDITLLNIINKVKILFLPPFTPKIGDLADIVRLEGPKKEAIVSCSGPEKQATSLL